MSATSEWRGELAKAQLRLKRKRCKLQSCAKEVLTKKEEVQMAAGRQIAARQRHVIRRENSNNVILKYNYPLTKETDNV